MQRDLDVMRILSNAALAGSFDGFEGYGGPSLPQFHARDLSAPGPYDSVREKPVHSYGSNAKALNQYSANLQSENPQKLQEFYRPDAKGLTSDQLSLHQRFQQKNYAPYSSSNVQRSPFGGSIYQSSPYSSSPYNSSPYGS